MLILFTASGWRKLALAAALAGPGLAAAQQGPSNAQALSAFASKARAQGLNPADVASPLVTDSYFDPSTALTHTYLQQRVNGLVIFNATGAIHTDQAGKVVLATQAFVPDAAAKAPSATPMLSAEQAVTAAAVSLGLPRPVGLRTVVDARAADGLTFNDGGISERPIPVRLLYTRQGEALVLVWNVTIAQLDQLHHWNVRIDAQTGRLVEQNDYTVSEQTSFGELVQRSQQRALAFGQAAAPRSILGTAAAGSLTVYPVPTESPSVGSRQVVPLASANATYSPYGWQASLAPSGTFPDTYSLASSGKFLTRGNNVAAYDDNSNTTSGPGNANFTSSASSPDGGSTLNFDFPFVQASGARANLNAAITNLFYWNNMVHDVMMAHGFDEVSGNFQYKNATGAGAGTDPVRAEAQDGSGRNNANFSTPPDGSSGTMQMYLWDNLPANALTITSPSTIAGTYKFGTASFGSPVYALTSAFCGTIVAVNDGVSADGGVHSCATPYLNAAAVNGNIALIERGGCTGTASNNFTDKVKIAQTNGAIAAIIFDNVATSTTPLVPGGTDATVTIPVIGISGVDGARIQAALATSGTAAACFKTGPDFDGAFDDGIVSHEFGHGISNRLTGGPANSSCVIQTVTSGTTTVTTQSMGEGWSDFFALWMTTQPGDQGGGKRYVGTYVEGQTTATGPGIRTYPYSTNITTNPLTYGKVGTASYSETHALGEVWTTVLWDLNWQFIYRYGYSTDFFAAPTSGNNRMLKLVLDGCKLQVCNPGFLDGRDALLRADTLTNRAANADLIWNVFARRGMGYSAVQGDRVSGTPRLTGIKEAFDLPPTAKAITLASKNSVVTGSALEAYPNPAQDLLTVRSQLSSAAPVQVAVLDLLGKVVVQAAAPASQLQQAGIELNTSRLATGIYVVRVTTTEGIFTTKVTIQH